MSLNSKDVVRINEYPFNMFNIEQLQLLPPIKKKVKKKIRVGSSLVEFDIHYHFQQKKKIINSQDTCRNKATYKSKDVSY